MEYKKSGKRYSISTLQMVSFVSYVFQRRFFSVQFTRNVVDLPINMKRSRINNNNNKNTHSTAV